MTEFCTTIQCIDTESNKHQHIRKQYLKTKYKISIHTPEFEAIFTPINCGEGGKLINFTSLNNFTAL
jgi:hypothetical protein